MFVITGVKIFSSKKSSIDLHNMVESNAKFNGESEMLLNNSYKIFQIAAFRKKKIKSFPLRVCSLDSQLEFNLDYAATGEFEGIPKNDPNIDGKSILGGELFEQVCRAFGLREEWFFGLQYEDTKGNICWLKKEKKVVDQNVNKDSCVLMFIAKFFPENVQDELIQEITQHLFFLQIKQAILAMEYYCPPEASVLLASYYVQAKYGDYDDSVWNNTGMLTSEDLLPQRVIEQYRSVVKFTR